MVILDCGRFLETLNWIANGRRVRDGNNSEDNEMQMFRISGWIAESGARVFLSLCLLLQGSVAHAGERSTSDEISYGISMAHMIANPERFNGRTVILQGYLKVRGSYSALFISRRDMEDGLTFNSVGIRNDHNERFLTSENNAMPVLIEAVFVADPAPPGLGHPISGRLVTIRNLSPMLAATR